jgi:hypothetical protein
MGTIYSYGGMIHKIPPGSAAPDLSKLGGRVVRVLPRMEYYSPGTPM